MDTAPRTTTIESIVLVPPSMMDEFNRRVLALNKKAHSFGLDPIVVGLIEERPFVSITEAVSEDGYAHRLVEQHQSNGHGHVVILNAIQITYPLVKLGDWTVVGKIEAAQAGNLAFCGSSDPDDRAAVESLADHGIECEHCRKSRRRKSSFVLRDAASGRHIQVGASCLKDFTGIDPGAELFLAQMASFISTCNDSLHEYLGRAVQNTVQTESYLADVAFLIRRSGFVSAKQADGITMPTYSDALQLPRWLKLDTVLCRDYTEQREQDLERARQVIAWAAELSADHGYERNVRILLAAKQLMRENKHLALAASAVHVYNRRQQTSDQPRQPASHVGTPGEKLTARVTVSRVMVVDTIYGPTTIMILRDQDGNALKWRTKRPPAEMVDAHKSIVFKVSFKVKEHGKYKYQPQTVITHLAIER